MKTLVVLDERLIKYLLYALDRLPTSAIQAAHVETYEALKVSLAMLEQAKDAVEKTGR